jgi:hypothetical protein
MFDAVSGKAPQMTQREARLKPHYAAEYPEISPNTWMSAKELAKQLVARVHARRKEGLYTRTFDPTHFDFRGDAAPRRRDRTRSTDIRVDIRPALELEPPGTELPAPRRYTD